MRIMRRQQRCVAAVHDQRRGVGIVEGGGETRRQAGRITASFAAPPDVRLNMETAAVTHVKLDVR